MPTRIALEHDIAAPVARVLTCLEDREVALRRAALEPAMSARLTEFTVRPEVVAPGAEPHLERIIAVVDANLPQTWLPAGISSSFLIRRTDRWWPDSDGYSGELSLQVEGLPVTCRGPFALRGFQHGSFMAVTLDLRVDLPLVGATVERLIRDRMEPVLAAELALIADEAEREGPFDRPVGGR